MRKTLIALTTAVSLLLVGTSAPSSAVSRPAAPPWRTTASSWTNSGAGAPLVLDLRFAQHRRFDRVVIDIDGWIPSGDAKYHKVFHRDGSGAVVPIRGGLQLNLHPASTFDGDGNEVYTGPRLVRPGLPALKAIALTGSFEGVTSFAFGLTPRRTPYRIFFLHDPQRIVIDFKHPV